jgi:hypothetical protein
MRLAVLFFLICMSLPAMAQEHPAIAQLRTMLGNGASLAFARATPLPGPAEGVVLDDVVITRDGQRGTIASLSLSGLRANGVASLIARDMVSPSPDGPVRIGRIAVADLVGYRRTDGSAQQPEDVKLRELVMEEVSIPGRPAIAIGRLTLNAYGLGQRSQGEIADLVVSGIPDNPVDGMSLGRIAFSGMDVAGLASAATARRTPGGQPTGRQSVTLDNATLRGGGAVLGGLAGLTIEGEVNDQGSGTGRLALRGLTAERTPLSAPFLAILGLDRLEASLAIEGNYDAAAGRLVIPAFALGVREVAALALGMTMDGMTPAAAQAQDPSRLRLIDARLRLADQSLYRRLVQAQAREQGGNAQSVRDQHAQIVAGMLTAARPDPAMEALREVLLRFIRGEINLVELQARPTAPVPVMGLAAGAQQGPAAIIRQLGLTARGERQP